MVESGDLVKRKERDRKGLIKIRFSRRNLSFKLILEQIYPSKFPRKCEKRI